MKVYPFVSEEITTVDIVPSIVSPMPSTTAAKLLFTLQALCN